jgi:hypothetical protein
MTSGKTCSSPPHKFDNKSEKTKQMKKKQSNKIKKPISKLKIKKLAHSGKNSTRKSLSGKK